MYLDLIKEKLGMSFSSKPTFGTWLQHKNFPDSEYSESSLIKKETLDVFTSLGWTDIYMGSWSFCARKYISDMYFVEVDIEWGGKLDVGIVELKDDKIRCIEILSTRLPNENPEIGTVFDCMRLLLVNIIKHYELKIEGLENE